METLNWMPQINRNRCTGCGACVAACPTQALARVDDKASLVAPSACTYCAACEALCPVAAIALPYRVVKPSACLGARHE